MHIYPDSRAEPDIQKVQASLTVIPCSVGNRGQVALLGQAPKFLRDDQVAWFFR